MQPGDLVFFEDHRFGKHRFYRVEACFHGALGQESLIELRSLTEIPGTAYTNEPVFTSLVPEPLLRGRTIYTPVRPENR
jgi:hypothetical protein